ncbi:uncharacterized protein CANTADRAFT_25978 [Suhomyces tanzawaensis NRRL Y-17324]|uniref:Alpha/beta-hydrolase n=1 Tax=Suhomyces tanzawaensis NRRL Y-17324 TaxID=984487 RepID=A0A1E4SLK0_9ASCO|nr:uncharacterized protein CANTADRAFT_25978 [Suhomyces tanzawaensis NRRL Y-17324]ODV80394.1 hypothetical protein CANTADRAFT_25978 [Suhomyces tanzawaensis NRRL Y-17324]
MPILPHDSEAFSKKTVFIGGINVHIYNADSLQSHVENTTGDIPVDVLYLVHERLGNYKYTEAFAFKILEQFYKKGGKQLVCVTFDVRNHGERTVDESKNQDWRGGNASHASDLITVIDGIVADLKLLTTSVPFYLDLDRYISRANKELGTTIKYRHSFSGNSLGGHAVIRFANEYPNLVNVLNPVIGCPDLTTLLVNRLTKAPLDSVAYDKKYFYFEYDELPLNAEQRLVYPESLHRHIAAQDISIYENFNMNIKLFSSHGKDDKLVPTKLASSWLDIYKNTNGVTEAFIQEGVGHATTEEMIDNFTTWLVKHI